METLPACAGAPSPARLREIGAIAPDAAARAELKAYLRIDGTDEDATLDRLIAVAIAHGEGFAGRLWLTRAVIETLPASAAWTRLGATPVRAIDQVEGLTGIAETTTLDVAGYAIDVDAAGDGWIRTSDPAGATRLRVHYQAGLATGWASLPEPLRQGAVRLASHLFTHRDAADEGAPPAAVAALWRPWRRMRLA